MKLLVIEDENGIREALLHTLKKEGYLADGAADGAEGYELIATGLYDLVILDIMLPYINGIDLLHRIRSEKITVPVILLTAKSTLSDKIDGMDSGADDYLTKPFEMEELLARIRMIARRQSIGEQSEPLSAVLSFRTLRLDTRSFEISTENGRSVKLGTKEYQLLEYLLRNHKQVLSREQITDKIWGYDSEAEYNNVDVYISFLRKKISFVGADVQIRAVRGIGYILEEAND